MEASTDIVVPGTGEVIDLATAQTDELGRFLYEARDFESRAREAKAQVTREVLRRMDFDGTYTLRVGDYELKGDGPGQSTEWDGDALNAVLTSLVIEGKISKLAKDNAVKHEWVARRSGLNALLKQGGEVAERLAACGTATDKKRYVSTDRKPK